MDANVDWTVTDDSGVKLICEIARLFYSARLSCFVSWPDFTGCGKTAVLYQGTTLVGP